MRQDSFWHLKALGYCNRQMRAWCNKPHGLSWRALIYEGIDADYLLSIDDSSMAQAAVAFAESTGWSTESIPMDTDTKGRCV